MHRKYTTGNSAISQIEIYQRLIRYPRCFSKILEIIYGTLI